MMWASFGRRRPSSSSRERVDVDAVGLQVDHADVGAALAQRRAACGRRSALDDHGVAGARPALEQERVGLHRAVGDEHLLGADPVAARRSTRAAAGSPPRCRRRWSRPGPRRTRARRPPAAPRRRRCRATAPPGEGDQALTGHSCSQLSSRSDRTARDGTSAKKPTTGASGIRDPARGVRAFKADQHQRVRDGGRPRGRARCYDRHTLDDRPQTTGTAERRLLSSVVGV